MESLNASNFTRCHTSYQHKDLKEKMYFKKPQAPFILHLKYFSCWICFPGEKKPQKNPNKNHQQKQLGNFAKKLILYF